MPRKRRVHPRAVEVLAELVEKVMRHLQPIELPEITAPQLNMLRLLDRKLAKTPSQLAELRGVSPSAVSHMLRRMENDGLIRRYRDLVRPHNVFVVLTEKGEWLSRWPAVADKQLVEDTVRRLMP